MRGGDNSTDKVYINDYFIGNFSTPSPDVFSFDSDYLEVDTVANFTINSTSTNITYILIVYPSYDGCDYDIDTCISLVAARNTTMPFIYIIPYLIMAFACLVVILGAVSFVKS